MKICWDNLEGLRYSKRTSKWYTENGRPYIYKDVCRNCGDPFLAKYYSKTSWFCGLSCSNHFNKMSGKILSSLKHLW